MAVETLNMNTQIHLVSYTIGRVRTCTTLPPLCNFHFLFNRIMSLTARLKQLSAVLKKSDFFFHTVKRETNGINHPAFPVIALFLFIAQKYQVTLFLVRIIFLPFGPSLEDGKIVFTPSLPEFVRKMLNFFPAIFGMCNCAFIVH